MLEIKELDNGEVEMVVTESHQHKALSKIIADGLMIESLNRMESNPSNFHIFAKNPYAAYEG